MGSEIEVPETPNWLQELEAKRERRLKARLAHETGAGAPCLKCGDKCPGLDLHFWRKCCKICKCSKEEHEVQDDDIYGWAQFQLLGSKPNKIKTKIVLPGKKDEVELDWAPKGHKETVDKYLKTLPPEHLPVKGSQAAQDRKQLLQKQIPIHDIDPTLCHELTEDELNKMNDYINHVKQASVGVGQIVSLSSIIKGNLHKLNPNEAAIIASRYAKGVPLSEIVKLQSQSRSSLLKPHNITQGLEKLNINESNNKSLPSYLPNTLNTIEHNFNPLVGNKIHDVNYPGYTRDTNQSLPSAQFSSTLRPSQQKGFLPGQNQSSFDPTVDERLLQGTNFDPKSIPSHFFNQNVGNGGQPNLPYEKNFAGYKSGDGTGEPNSAFVPYSKISSEFNSGDNYIEENSPSKVNYTSSLPKRSNNMPSGFKSGEIKGQNVPYTNTPGSYRPEQNYEENINSQRPIYSKNLTKGSDSQGFPPGYTSGYPVEQFASQPATGSSEGNQIYENVEEMKKWNPQGLPSYAPGKYNVHTEVQSPTTLPKNVRDLAFSTYDQNRVGPNETDPNLQQNFPGQPNELYKDYPTGTGPYNQGTMGQNESEYNTNNSNLQPNIHGQAGVQYERYPTGTKTYNQGMMDPNETEYNANNPNVQPNIHGRPAVQYERYPTGLSSEFSGTTGTKTGERYSPSSRSTPGYSSGFRSGEPTGDLSAGFDQSPDKCGSGQREFYPSGTQPGNSGQNIFPGGDGFNQNIPGHLPNVSYENYPGGSVSGFPTNTGSNVSGHGNKPGKKLSELYPGKINIDEDFVHPSQVAIGAIQDINYPEIKAATHGTNDFYEDYSPDSLREILNNIKLPDCHYCKKPFEENEFAITIDRANVLFHAECFKCAGCNQILADNVYFYNKETDNIYCGRDYAKIRGFPRCKACDELIFTKEYCLAENSTFHLKHFCCIECDKPLAGQDYTLEDEMPYCLPCFEQSKASKCSSCCRVIKPDEIGCNLNGIHFHANDDCFACKMCQKPLMGKKLLLRNGKLYCSHDCFGADK